MTVPDGYCECAHPGPKHSPAWTGDDVVYPCDKCSCPDFRLPLKQALEDAWYEDEIRQGGGP